VAIVPSLDQPCCGIYAITNKVTGRRYIGRSIDIGRRWQAHLLGLSRGRHYNIHLQRAWLRYGDQAFVFSVIETVDDPDRLIEREQFHVCQTTLTYNMVYPVAFPAGRKRLLRYRTSRRRKRAVKAYAIKRRLGSPEDVLTSGEAAQLVPCSRHTMRRWITEGDVYAWQIDGYWLINRDHFMATLPALQQRLHTANKTRMATARAGWKGAGTWLETNDLKERRSVAIRDALQRPEARAKLTAALYRRYNDPEERRKVAERMTARYSEPAARVTQSAVVRASYEDPRVREKVSVGVRRRIVQAKADIGDPHHILTQSEVARAVGCHVETVQTAIKRGRLPAVRRGIFVFVWRDDVDAWRTRWLPTAYGPKQ